MIDQASLDQARKLEEAEFHNRRERDRQDLGEETYLRKYSNKKWYAVTRQSQSYVARWMAAHCPGKVALDYCCGLGGMSLELARHGATVYGIDISAESVATAQSRLNEAGFADRSYMQVMDAENLTFAADTFDVIVCSGVLHHLDLSRAYAHLARVLKPTGRIICIEALAHNPAIMLYRRLTPHLRTGWETEHILGVPDISRASALFGHIDKRFFHLFAIGAVPFRKTPLFGPVLTFFEAIDAAVLRLPVVKLMAWQVIFELSEPRLTDEALGP